MSDLSLAKTVLHEIAVQAHTLGTGLQNVAPPQSVIQKPNSVQYLLETAQQLEKTSQEIGNLLPDAE